MIIWPFFIALLIAFELVADFFAKEYSLSGGSIFWLAAIASYIIANIFWLTAMKDGSGLIRGANIFSVGSAIMATLLGYYFFQEKISNLQFVGVVMGIFALILIFSK